MGKKTDKLYVTYSEHSAGGHSATSAGHASSSSSQRPASFARLPFDHCALSLKPFENPVCEREGIVYDVSNIIPFLRQYGNISPVTGSPLTSSDLFPLNFTTNEEGEYIDPLTFKVFTHHSAIVAVLKSGNVYSKDTVERLNIKAGWWRDLITDEEISKSDIVTIQDPNDTKTRDLSNFHHLKNALKVSSAEEEGTINLTNPGLAKAVARATGKTTASDASTAQSSKAKDKGKQPVKAQEQQPEVKEKEEKKAQSAFSKGLVSSSLTSTAASVVTKNEGEDLEEEEIMFPQIKDKSYLRLVTSLGPLNLELHSDRAPRTCYNFMRLAEEGKYDNTIFHRLIPGFMIQGGDPTGTGRGGQSIWGTRFADEIQRSSYKHDARGVVSMANSGPNTNGSQFFLTFKATPHLDSKHTVFGKLVGGEETLDRMEKARCDGEKPLRDIRLVEVEVFKDAFAEWKGRRERKRGYLEAEKSGKKGDGEGADVNWFGVKLKPEEEKEAGEKVVKKRKLEEQGLLSGLSGLGDVGNADGRGDERKKKKTKGFGNFEGW
ncbi:hypothetical protein BT69DRAFT_1282455 [Atractiella rhizophila]|nr:hypothetical protein BT69DRAFT_1282455 [Atractiella rhizophila]